MNSTLNPFLCSLFVPTLPDITCSTLAFIQHDLRTALNEVAQLGVKQVELPIRGDGVWPGHVDADALIETPHVVGRIVREAMEDTGIAIVSAGFHVSAHHKLQAELERFHASCVLLNAVGGKSISIFLLDSPDAGASERYAAFAQAAKACDLQLFVETHRNTMTENPLECLRLSQELGLRLNLDYDHYRSQGYTFTDYEFLLPHVDMLQVREQGTLGLGEHFRPILQACSIGQITLEYLQMPGERVDFKPPLIKLRNAICDDTFKCNLA